MVKPEELADPAFHVVSGDRVADLAADGDTESCRACVRAVADDDHEVARVAAPPAALCHQELAPPPKSLRLRETPGTVVRRRT